MDKSAGAGRGNLDFEILYKRVPEINVCFRDEREG